MIRLLRPFSAVLLILALAVGSVSMAVARGHAAAAAGGSTIVICSGYGVMTITLDAEGNPTGPVMPCPDCLAGLALAALPAEISLPVFASHGQSLLPTAGAAQIPVLSPALPPARGPPRLV